MSTTTDAQRQARSRNAAVAAQARHEKSAARAADVDTAIEQAYAPVLDELDAALEHPITAPARCRRALLMLARVAAGPHYDPARSRSIALAIREAYSGNLSGAGAHHIDKLEPLAVRVEPELDE